MKILLSIIFLSFPAVCIAWETSRCTTQIEIDEKALYLLGKAAEKYIVENGELPDLYEGIPEPLDKKVPPEISHYLIHGSSYSDAIGFSCDLKKIEFDGGKIKEEHYRSCDYEFSTKIGLCQNKVLRIKLNDS